MSAYALPAPDWRSRFWKPVRTEPATWVGLNGASWF